MKSRELLEIREEIIETLKNLAKEMDAIVYLFGSYARGDYMLESDVDIIVVTNMFKNMNFIDRTEAVRLKLPSHISFDIIPLTPDELKKKLENIFYREISKYWMEIKPS